MNETSIIKNKIHSILSRYGITIHTTDVFGKRSLKSIQESGDKIQPEDWHILQDLIQRFHCISSKAEYPEKELALEGKDIPKESLGIQESLTLETTVKCINNRIYSTM